MASTQADPPKLLQRAKPVAHESADAQRAPAGIAHGGGDPLRLLFQIHMNSI